MDHTRFQYSLDIDEKQDSNPTMKGPKRKRLAKACDACHKSKRRCDGTAPCSNCYYASKACTYTDSTGRSVPAPRPYSKQPQPSDASPTATHYSESAPRFSQIRSVSAYPPSSIGSSDHSEEEHKLPRKRLRHDLSSATPRISSASNISLDDLAIDAHISKMSIDRPSVELDPSLTRELTNLFFTHCHPAHAVIHKPTFSAALGHNRVPAHLLHAVCALAAPLSKQPKIRTSPSRFAGKPFAQEALALMFDHSGRLAVEPNLATAQALCLLQMHDVLTTDKNTMWPSRYHDLALTIVEALGVHSPEHPTLTPVPSPEFIHASTEREAIRRIFWFIHTLDVIASIYFKKPITFSDGELRLRLPVDETSFEMGVHSTLPEYLYLPAVRTAYASEFGHLIRILSIYAKVEFALDELNDPEPHHSPTAALKDAEQLMEARQRSQRGPKSEPQWALSTLDLILSMLGDRAKNSILMGAALWSLIKYCKRDDAQVRAWSTEYEEAWGTRMIDLAQDYRPQPSPPPQHMYPALMPQQQQPQQPGMIQQPLPLPPPPPPQPLSLHHHHPSLPQASHRRLSEPRNPPSLAAARPPPHQHGGDVSYTTRRSPSDSPTAAYRLDELRMHGGRPGTHDPQKHLVYSGREETGLVPGGSPIAPPRVHGVGESAQSLPSLKASGLLDSWPGVLAQQSPNGTRVSPRRSPPMFAHDTDPRSAGMPVGLQWLANESR